MQLVPMLLMLHYTRIGLTEHGFVKTVTKTFSGFLNFLVDFIFDLRQLLFDKYVGTVTFLAVAVINQRVIERIYVSRSFPRCRVHEDSGIDTDNVLMQQRHRIPPIFLDVILQLHAILTVVINSAQTVVNLTGGKYESVLLAMCD